LSLIRDLYDRFGHIGAEGLKFLVVGGAGFVVQMGIQDPLHMGMGVGAITAQTIGTIGGIILTFFGNRYWTYRAKRSHGKEFIRETWQFLLWAVIGWIIQAGLQAAVTYGLGMTDGISYNVATMFGIAIATVFRFWAYRTFVFTGGKEDLPPVTAEQLEPEQAA